MSEHFVRKSHQLDDRERPDSGSVATAIADRTICFGRDSDSDFVIQDPRPSRRQDRD